ncbi:MAG: hypothetical protein LBT00_01745, partial [Spirochaetaceae bacterium]|nr:hypothetical protein [Spirochaetaceae bacterium]
MKKLILFIIVAALAAGFVFIPQKLAGGNTAVPAGGPEGPGGSGGRPGGPQTRNQNTVFAVRTANAERRTLEAYIEVNGNIVSEKQVAVVPDVAGKLV